MVRGRVLFPSGAGIKKGSPDILVGERNGKSAPNGEALMELRTPSEMKKLRAGSGTMVDVNDQVKRLPRELPVRATGLLRRLLKFPRVSVEGVLEESWTIVVSIFVRGRSRCSPCGR